MFEKTLLDSSSSRSPVLTGVDLGISAGVGLVSFVAVFFCLPLVAVSEAKSLVPSALAGSSMMLFGLMVCYVRRDARNLGLNVPIWLTLVLALNVIGFLVYVVYSSLKAGDGRRASIPLACVIQALLLGMVLVIPLIEMQALPKIAWELTPVPPPPPGRPPGPAVRPVKPVTRPEVLSAPPVIPRFIARFDIPQDFAKLVAPGVEGIPGCVPEGVRNGIPGSILIGGPMPPPPPQPKPHTQVRIRVGGQVEQARLMFQPKPEYPPLAKMARIQGVVRLEAIISKDGTIQDLKMISGHPLLVKSAMEAVARWRYQPTLLNGEPVEVVTEIDVNFTLAE